MQAPIWLRVALDVPLDGPFDYRSTTPVQAGQRVIVPFGRRQLVGMVLDVVDAPAVDPQLVRDVERVLDDVEPLPADWLRLTGFAAAYYHRPLGEVMLPALPGPLRKPSAYQGKRAGAGPVARLLARRRRADAAPTEAPDARAELAATAPTLNPAQREAVDAIQAETGYAAFLLHGVTGSGKTEVYLHAAAHALTRGRQVLLLVPEINLTPQLQRALVSRLQKMAGEDGVAVLHSGLAESERLAAWLAAVTGRARVVLGTRLSLLTPLPQLGLIVVDEEHDPSYKQQEGLRYSARDLAVWRARDLDIPVVLGSATPSLETWHHAERGQYRRLALPARAVAATPPAMRLLDTRNVRLEQGMAPELLAAIGKRLEQREQVLVFLNRRGYAPVLHCGACGWVSDCTRCSAHLVLHRARAGTVLCCHHCGARERVPHACPDCGNQDLQPMGRGTQRVEEHLAERFPQARIARIDADSTRLKGSAEQLFARVHAGEIDILVGTQMVAKGHDFRNLGLVGVLNADAMLFSQDFRAPERLFAQLMQVAGRAGRHLGGSQVIIQTGYPEQPVYQALLRHDYQGFAAYGLAERRSAGLPPFSFQALLTAESDELALTLGFLEEARALGEQCQDGQTTVMLYDPVPLRVVRVNRVERAQLLVESPHRPALQAFLRAWLAALAGVPSPRRLRWQLEVDPLEI
ncbi:primosomal protein N' [Verticiella sediminum]|uniref:Replication restart protein PriA n=1 Tax=Verticiella sediminum TaxID=1247510 RepID=A0A556B061_9BURK|nr:primosomal protein N' [Verticiella sediminum]TSH98571.1 primosomal protein N' [Verticiella sediminum]